MIINACLNGNWGKEERKFVQKFPFLPMQYFEASFVLMEDKFTVSKMWKFLNCKAMISFYKQWVILISYTYYYLRFPVHLGVRER